MSNLKLNHANNVEPLVASIVILVMYEAQRHISNNILSKTEHNMATGSRGIFVFSRKIREVLSQNHLMLEKLREERLAWLIRDLEQGAADRCFLGCIKSYHEGCPSTGYDTIMDGPSFLGVGRIISSRPSPHAAVFFGQTGRESMFFLLDAKGGHAARTILQAASMVFRHSLLQSSRQHESFNVPAFFEELYRYFDSVSDPAVIASLVLGRATVSRPQVTLWSAGCDSLMLRKPNGVVTPVNLPNALAMGGFTMHRMLLSDVTPLELQLEPGDQLIAYVGDIREWQARILGAGSDAFLEPRTENIHDFRMTLRRDALRYSAAIIAPLVSQMTWYDPEGAVLEQPRESVLLDRDLLQAAAEFLGSEWAWNMSRCNYPVEGYAQGSAPRPERLDGALAIISFKG